MNNPNCEDCYRADCVCEEDEEIESTRKVYPTNQEAVNGAIEQMANIEVTGQVKSIEQASAARALRIQSAQQASMKHDKLRAKLRAQNKQAYEADKLTGDIVYPKSRWAK